MHQKYFDKTIGEYKALAKVRDVAKRKAVLATQNIEKKEREGKTDGSE